MGEKRIIANYGVILTTRELEEYFEKLGVAHNIAQKSSKETYPIPEMEKNFEYITKTYELLNEHLRLRNKYTSSRRMAIR